MTRSTPSPVRALRRAYQLWCAREDMRYLGLSVPDGVAVCAHCQQLDGDEGSSRLHLLRAHAW